MKIMRIDLASYLFHYFMQQYTEIKREILKGLFFG